jgi:SAM-dependent methyltransferase
MLMRRVWALFERPAVYRLNQLLTGYLLSLAYKRLLLKHLELKGAETILDIGCGTGDYAPLFEKQRYIGIDYNPDYINRAKQIYGNLPNVNFFCVDINELPKLNFAADHAYCAAVTHHLTDEEVLGMARSVLKAVGKRFVIVDLYLPNLFLNPIGFLLVKMDRGRYGRSKDDWLALIQRTGARVTKTSFDFGFPYHAAAVTLESPAISPAQ